MYLRRITGLIKLSQVHSYQHSTIQICVPESALLSWKAMGLPLTPCASSSFMRFCRQENEQYTKCIDFSISLFSALKEKRKKNKRKGKRSLTTADIHCLGHQIFLAATFYSPLYMFHSNHVSFARETWATGWEIRMWLQRSYHIQ